MIIANSLSYKNLATSGNAYETTSDQPIADNRDFPAPVGSPGQVVYFSMLIKPLDAMNAGWPDTYFGFYLSNFAITKGGGDTHWGILDPTSNNYVASNVVVQQNVTYFLVARITYASNGKSVAELFIDPAPGQSLPATPDATLTLTNLSQSTFYGTGTSIRCVYDELRLGNSFNAVAPTQ